MARGLDTFHKIVYDMGEMGAEEDGEAEGGAMNRRDFMKVLAGIPLLGLLAKLPEEHGELKIAGYPDLGTYVADKTPFEADDAAKGSLHVRRDGGFDGDYWYIGDAEPFQALTMNDPDPWKWSYWNGKEWIRIEML